MPYTPAIPYAGIIVREILRRERETTPAAITLARSEYRDVTPRGDEAMPANRSA